MQKMDSHDVASREGAPLLARPTEHSRRPSLSHNGSSATERTSNDVWTSAISRLQSQVSYNTGMLESHRRQFTEIETALGRLHQEMNHMSAMLETVRAEVRSRPAANPEPSRLDPADMDVLTGQMQRLTNKLNEIDGLSLQMDMMKNRMKRLEEDSPLMPTATRQPITLTHREHSSHEAHHVPPAGAQIPNHHMQRPPPSQHAPLPPMRTGSIPSPQTNRPPSFPGDPILASQGAHPHHHAHDNRPFSGEPAHAQHPAPGQHGAPAPGYRPSEPLPPQSAISGWRPADPYQQPSHSPAAAPAAVRGHPMEVDPQSGHSSGWATVNTSAALKRPPEDSRSPYGSPLGDSSKRPKLAPLMPSVPRSNYGDDGYPHSHSVVHSVHSNLSDGSQQPRSRAPSDGSQPQSHPTPASTLQHSFRFITSTQQADNSELWRPDQQREQIPPAQATGRGGRGGRGRGRGRGGRGRGGSHHNHTEGHEASSTPEWDRTEVVGSPASPNGYHHPVQHPHSPRHASRGGVVRRADAHAVAPADRHPDFPASPVQTSPADPYGIPNDGSMSSSGKKTRTKPIRNAEGILIRKDGRPDMRSVSSANNLRKVHAKKEAERAEIEEDGDGITRSGTPASAGAGDHDMSDEAPETSQDRQNELVSRLLTQGHAGAEERRVAEKSFSRHEDEPLTTTTAPAAAPPLKTEKDIGSREPSTQAAGDVHKEGTSDDKHKDEKSEEKQEDSGGVKSAQNPSAAIDEAESNIIVQPATATA